MAKIFCKIEKKIEMGLFNTYLKIVDTTDGCSSVDGSSSGFSTRS